MEDRTFNESQKLLTIQEFMEVVEFKIDAFMVDECFLNLKEDTPIYIDASMIEWMGYTGKKSKQKENFMKILDHNFEKDTDYYDFKNKEYQEWLDNNKKNFYDRGLIYPPIATGNGSYQTKHIIVLPDTFRKVLMMLKTSRANRIREYYISLEKLLRMYTMYQCGNLNMPMNRGYTRYCAIMELDKEIRHRYRVGCVYYIQEEQTKNIKIGWCWNLQKRLTALQISNSQILKVVKYELTQFPYNREQELHKKYVEFHIRGECYSSDIKN
jgi:phage anti-repressor protein